MTLPEMTTEAQIPAHHIPLLLIPLGCEDGMSDRAPIVSSRSFH